jgi:hypothetical protein
MHVADIKSLNPNNMPPYDINIPDDENHVCTYARSAYLCIQNLQDVTVAA